MLKSNVAQTMPAHDPALVNIAVDADDAPLSRVLPHGDVAVVGQYRLFRRVHGYHDFVVVYLTQQVLVVEVAPRI